MLIALAVSQPVGASLFGVPRGVRNTLLAKSRQLAESNGESQPSDIEAVKTTYRQAQRLFCGRSCNGPIPAATPVYVVSMRGNFGSAAYPHLRDARGHRQSPPVTVISVPYIASSMQAATVVFGHTYPNLKAVGIPVRLRPSRHNLPAAR